MGIEQSLEKKEAIVKEFGWDLTGDSPDNPRSKFFFEADAEKIMIFLEKDKLVIQQLEASLKESQDKVAQWITDYDELESENHRIQSRLQEAEKDVKSWKDSFSDSVRHIKDLEDKKMELEKEVDRLTHLHNLDHSLADQWQKKNEELEARLEEREKEFQEVKLHNELHEDLENVVIVELESELERHKAVVGAAKYLIHPSKNESPSEVCPECKTYGVGELREALTALEEFRKGKS